MRPELTQIVFRPSFPDKMLLFRHILPMEQGRIRKIIHIDMDAFYASVEQRDDPALKGRPVAVGYPAKRGVVAAASYEARRFGVRSAMPSTTAMRKCPELVFVPPRFEVYRAVSQQIRAIFTDYTPLVEPLSLDEAYLDVTDNLKSGVTAWELAKEIRKRIYDETELTASAGISYNKFLAKLASDHQKPNGQFAIMPDEGEVFVASLPVAKFHGVGPVTAAAPLALRRAQTCVVRPSISCEAVSASQGSGITNLQEVRTIGRSSLTASESPLDRRRPSGRTLPIRLGSKRA
jgi:impB/mucB/samB family